MEAELVRKLRGADAVALGGRIKDLRLERGLLQAELADGVVSGPYISRIERGERRPEPEVLQGLAKKLGVSVASLLGDEDTADHDARTQERNRVKLELDFAELEVATGSAAAALARLEHLPAHVDKDLREKAEFLHLVASRVNGGDLRSSVSGLEDFVAKDLSSGELWLQAKLHLCRALKESGEYEAAIATGREALTRLDSLGLAGTDVAVQLAVTVAGVHESLGEVDRALRLAERTLEVADSSASPQARAYVHWNASMCESDRGDVAAALSHTGKALTLLGSDGNARHLAILRSNFGALLLEKQPPAAEEALPILEQAAVELAATDASSTELASSAIELARAMAFLGRKDEAIAKLTPIATAGQSIGQQVVASALLLHGEILLDSDPSGAADEIRKAVAVLAGMGQDRAMARLWFRIGARLEALGDASGALDSFRRGGVAAGVMPAQTAVDALL